MSFDLLCLSYDSLAFVNGIFIVSSAEIFHLWIESDWVLIWRGTTFFWHCRLCWYYFHRRWVLKCDIFWHQKICRPLKKSYRGEVLAGRSLWIGKGEVLWRAGAAAEWKHFLFTHPALLTYSKADGRTFLVSQPSFPSLYQLNLSGQRLHSFRRVTGMAGEDKFSLRWNDFESSLSTSFQQFRGSLLDVEILCNSGAVVAAHRLVLCACSEVLREALLRVRYLFSFEMIAK